MKLVARDYQVEAIEAICNGLKVQNRVTAVMACGTGKTLVSLWASEKMGVQTIVVFMPSLMLIKQTIDTWTEQTEWPWYSYMAVCCDDKLLDDDLIDIDAKECCFDVCIDEEQVRTFIGRTEIEEARRSVHIVFCTYQSSHIIPKDIEFDLGIFDEAHKTAHKDMGSFRHALYDENVTIKKRLFLTATPRHYQLKGKTTHLEYSMSNEKVYGPIVYRLDFAQAIRRGIICDYKILITLIDDNIVNDSIANKLITEHGKSFNMQMMANAIALKQAFDKYPVNRAVAFHRTIKDTKEFTKTAFHIHDIKCNLLDINSRMNSDTRAHIMRAFEYSTKAIISNARCLSEGVDIPSIDLVAFLSPKKSKIDIIQSVGRAMRNAPGKKCGYILLPIFVEQDKLDKQTLESSEYRYIMDILNSLCEYDTDLQQQITDSALSREKTGEHNEINKIQFLNTGFTTNDLNSAIRIDILERFKDYWEIQFNNLKQYYQENINKQIPSNKNIRPLKAWCGRQRQLYRLNQLEKDKIEKLESINFYFNANDNKWFKQFVRFQKLVIKYNTTSLEALSMADSSWFYKQRKAYQENDLSQSRYNNLINFLRKHNLEQDFYKCVPTIERTDKRLKSLIQFYDIHKNWDILQLKDISLYKYSAHIDRNRLPKNYVTQLDERNFPWRPHVTYEDRWNSNYAKVQKYKHDHGNLSVHKCKDNKEIIGWLDLQRKKIKKHKKFQPGQLEKLIVLGINDARGRMNATEHLWNQRYNELLSYKQENKTLIIRSVKTTYNGLKTWVERQRAKYRNGSNFLPGQKEKLISIGLFNGKKKGRWKKTKAT